MRQICLLLLYLGFTFSAYSQGDHHNLISKGKFDKAAEKLKSDYRKDTASVGTAFSLARLYNASDFQSYNTDTAYFYIKKAESVYRQADEKELKKISRDDINIDTISALKEKIMINAFHDAQLKNTIPQYNHFIGYYTDAEFTLKNCCRTYIYQLAFDEAKDIHSIDGYNQFIRTYPAATQVKQAVGYRNQLAFIDATTFDTPEGYKKFIKTYPEAVQVSEAWNNIYTLEYSAIEHSRESEKFNKYLQEYPASPYAASASKEFEWLFFLEETSPGDAASYKRFMELYPQRKHITAAIDSLIHLSAVQNDYLMIRYLLENHREKTDAKKLQNILYTYIALDGESLEFDWFAEQFPEFDNAEKLRKDRSLVSLIDTINLNKLSKEASLAIELYIAGAAPCRQAYKALVALIRPRIDAKDWSGALTGVKKFELFFSNSPDYQSLVEMLSEKVNSDIKRHSFGPLVNSKECNAYVPTISGDFRHLYFCGRDRNDNTASEDIFESLYSNGVWQKPRLMDELSTPASNDAPLNVSTDGTQMLMFRSGVIHTTAKTAEGWSEPVKMPEPINLGRWNADAMYTSDGQAVMFTSQRDGGYNFETDPSRCNEYPTDIYVCIKQGENWSEPVNLGPIINTSGCERTPFLHPDMKTLYFSSDGHGGLGSLDVYRSTRLNDSSWTAWSVPENLGKEVNGSGSDWGYKISTDGTKAYFSEGEMIKDKRSEALYWINLPPGMRPDYVATVKGQLRTPQNKPIQAKLIWEDLSTGKIIGEAQSDPATGNFFIVLPLGKIYGYHVDKTEYFPISGNIDLRKTTTAVEKLDTISMVTFKEMIDDSISLPINNLFFNFAEKTLLSYSIPELKRVAGIIKKHDLIVEIAGHTDNIGDSVFNMKLSLGRANSVKSFLTEQGCKEDFLRIRGFGQEKPISDNKTEEGRAKNRRVVMKILPG